MEPDLREGFFDGSPSACPEVALHHILKTYDRLSSFLAKPRNSEKVEGWQQIRVTGDDAFAYWDNLRKDFVWRGGKFEVLYEITSKGRLKAATVTFDGESRRVE